MQKWITRIIAFFVGASGIVGLISALVPSAYDRLILLREVVPMLVRLGSRTLSLLAGFGLVIIAQNILARKRRAWYLSILLLSLTLITHLTKGLDFEEAIFSAIPLFLLIRYRSIFTVASTRLNLTQIIHRVAIVVLTLLAYILLGYTLLQTQFSVRPGVKNVESDYIYSTVGVGQDSLIAETRLSKWFEKSLWIISTTGVITILLYLFGPLIDGELVTDKEVSEVRSLAEVSPNSVGYFATMPGNKYFWNHNRTQVMAYRISGNVAVAIGEPYGPGPSEETVTEFASFMEQRGILTAIYNAREVVMKRLKDTYKSIKIGEEAVISTEGFTLTGSKIADVRHAVSRMMRDGVSYEWCDASTISWTYVKELDMLHANWLKKKNLPPLTFSMEYYPFDPNPSVKILIIKNLSKKIIAGMSFLPYDEGRGMALDLMLKSDLSPNGTMEAGIAEALKYFKDRGIDHVSLSLAPLANTDMQIIYKHFNRLYQFKSLHKFKEKFLPQWHPKYILIDKKLSTPKALYASAVVHLKKVNS